MLRRDRLSKNLKVLALCASLLITVGLAVWFYASSGKQALRPPEPTIVQKAPSPPQAAPIQFEVALVDLREASPTYGRKNTLYVGSLRPWQILIPPGVGHGYKVIGSDAAMLVYVTNRVYNPKDEGRIAYNQPGIAYDWELQHK